MQIAKLKDCVIYSIHLLPLLPLLLSLALFPNYSPVHPLKRSQPHIHVQLVQKKDRSFMYSKFYVSKG